MRVRGKIWGACVLCTRHSPSHGGCEYKLQSRGFLKWHALNSSEHSGSQPHTSLLLYIASTRHSPLHAQVLLHSDQLQLLVEPMLSCFFLLTCTVNAPTQFVPLSADPDSAVGQANLTMLHLAFRNIFVFRGPVQGSSSA